MIRHSSSFFISLIFHITILFLLLYSWKNIPIFHKNNDEKICLKLSCVAEKKIEPIVKKTVIPKKIEPIIKKEMKKPVVKKQVIKKVEILKKKPLSVPVIKKEVPKEIEEIKERKQEVIEKKITEVVTEEIPQKENIQTRKNMAQKEYINENIQKIVKLLNENLYYPRSARKRGITGEVVLKFKLSTEARVESIKVIKSQNDILSRAAVKTIEDLSGRFPKPKEDLILEVPINYDLKRM
jgi:protein TonB